MKEFFDYLKECSARVSAYYAETSAARFPLEPNELMDGTFAYFERGGKRLRPAIISLSAAALGGAEREEAALPCALGLEFYHNYTLIHDDILDRDDTRRGKPSVHTFTKALALKDGVPEEVAAEYGTANAILAGDALHSAAIASIASLSQNGAVKPEVTLKILSLIEGTYGMRLLSGEAIDTKNGLYYGKGAFYALKEEDVLHMISGKTSALFAVCAVSGAMIGKNSADENDPEIAALREFAENCGMAFQLQDDILGIQSTEETLGKPVGSDIREGKPTVLLIHAYQNASEKEKKLLRTLVGSAKSKDEILAVRDILIKNGGVSYTQSLAEDYIRKAQSALSSLPDSRYKKILFAWSEFMLHREK